MREVLPDLPCPDSKPEDPRASLVYDASLNGRNPNEPLVAIGIA
jgi:hypothetical protein